MKETTNQDSFRVNENELKEYIDDFYKALNYANDKAGECIEGLSQVASEQDRIQYLEEEFRVLTQEINRVMDCYLTLAKDADETINILKGVY